MTRLTSLRRTLVGLALVLPTAYSCADPSTAPPTTARRAPGAAPASGVGSGPRADVALASARWEATTRALVASRTNFSPAVAVRAYALHAMAVYGAVVAADFGGGRAQFEVRRGAIAGASAQLLASLFPEATATLERQVVADGLEASNTTHPQYTRGVAIGRTMADRMRAWSLADGFGQAWSGVPLTPGAGLWVGVPGAAPAGFQLPTTKAYTLLASSQFRPVPPPAFGSPEFAAAVLAVRAITDARTPRQAAIANFWNQGPGTQSTLGYWLEKGAALAAEYGLDDREVARLFALVSVAAMDAQIGCFEAKYFYRTVRPSTADPGITRPAGLPGAPYGLPNHPAYPSGHSCISASAARVLERYFPAHANELGDLVAEAGLSRVYGGLHYAFDVTAGQTLGRRTADWTLDYDRSRGVLAAVPGLGVAP